jgi:hypothetical protein
MRVNSAVQCTPQVDTIQNRLSSVKALCAVIVRILNKGLSAHLLILQLKANKKLQRVLLLGHTGIQTWI